MAGEFRLPISAEHRTSSGVEVGDEVEVEIEPDTQAREVDVPPDLCWLLETSVPKNRRDVPRTSRRSNPLMLDP